MNRIPGAISAARTERLVVTESAGELLVYDMDSHHIHQLNQASVMVWRHCTGHSTLQEIAAESGLAVGLVQMAVGKLAAAHLLEHDVPELPRVPRGSRRALLRKAGVAAGIAIPAVVSVSAPLAAQANSSTSRYYKCSNEACADRACSIACQASNICPGCTKDMSNLMCMNFDGPFVPDMCAVYCTCP